MATPCNADNCLLSAPIRADVDDVRPPMVDRQVASSRARGRVGVQGRQVGQRNPPGDVDAPCWDDPAWSLTKARTRPLRVDPIVLVEVVVRAVADGAAYLSPKVAARVVAHLAATGADTLAARRSSARARVDALSPREREALAFLGSGLSPAPRRDARRPGQPVPLRAGPARFRSARGGPAARRGARAPRR
ncbi:hypothetical protein GCM10027186_18570 [Micromonospora schwarzwaldensis]